MPTAYETPLILRADANARIGIGHLMRSLALAQTWRSLGGHAILATTGSADNLPHSVQSGEIELASLPSSYPDPADISAVLGLLQKWPKPWVCCDGYDFDSGYTQLLSREARGVVVIDDRAHQKFYRADVIVNQNIFAERLKYNCDPSARLLLGPRYALLRREFLQWANSRGTAVDRAKRVLVSMGGGDPDNQTLKVLRSLRRLQVSDLEVKAIVGLHNPHYEQLRTEAERPGPGRVELVYNPADIPSLMAWADIAISAGGSTCWELCFMGVPILVMELIDNQTGVVEGLADAGVAVNVGHFQNVTEDLLTRKIGNLLYDRDKRQSLSSSARRLVDGRGATRVCRVLRGESEDELCLRQATIQDAALLFEWRNEPAVRASALKQNSFSFDSHLEWLKSKLESPSNVIWILECDGRSVGAIRYDRVGECAEIDIVISAGFRGKGLGSKLLDLSAAEACRVLGVNCLVGIVKEDNPASRNAFKKSGFQEVGSLQHGSITCFRYERTLEKLNGRDDFASRIEENRQA